MNIFQERKCALKIFRTVADEKFQRMLANQNYCYREIIPIAPPEVWEILWGLPQDMPPSWAAAILRFATIELSQKRIEKLVALAATSSRECFNLLKYGYNYSLNASHIDKLVQGLGGQCVREAQLLLEIGNCIWQENLPTENKIGLSQTHVNFLLRIITQDPLKSRGILSEGMYYALPQEKFDELFLCVKTDPFQSSELLKLGCKYPLSAEREQTLYESALRSATAAENLLKTYSKFTPSQEQFDELFEVAATDANAAAEILKFGAPERYSQAQADMLWASASQDEEVAARLIIGVPTRIEGEDFGTEIYYESPSFVPSQAQKDALYERITNKEFLKSSFTSYLMGFGDLSFVLYDPVFAPSEAQLEALKRAAATF